MTKAQKLFCFVLEPDGRLQMLTSMDPLLLALPYLRSAERTVPLDHLLTDDDFPHVSDLVEMLSPDKMNKVANPKGTPDLNVWQWNESKTLEYLGQKIQRLTAAIQAGDLHLQGQSENYLKRKNESESMEECKKAAWEFLSDYLQEDLSLLLAKKLKIDLEKTSSPKKPKTNSNVNETKSSNGPKDDYTKNFNKALLKNTPEQNSKQKALAKSAKGTKNISSFFSKK